MFLKRFSKKNSTEQNRIYKDYMDKRLSGKLMLEEIN